MTEYEFYCHLNYLQNPYFSNCLCFSWILVMFVFCIQYYINTILLDKNTCFIEQLKSTRCQLASISRPCEQLPLHSIISFRFIYWLVFYLFISELSSLGIMKSLTITITTGMGLPFLLTCLTIGKIVHQLSVCIVTFLTKNSINKFVIIVTIIMYLL